MIREYGTQPMNPDSAHAHDDSGHAPLRVLLIEDSPLIRRSIVPVSGTSHRMTGEEGTAFLLMQS